MPLANDRDPSGVKPRDLSLTTGPQIGKSRLARSQNVRNDASKAGSRMALHPLIAPFNPLNMGARGSCWHQGVQPPRRWGRVSFGWIKAEWPWHGPKHVCNSAVILLSRIHGGRSNESSSMS